MQYIGYLAFRGVVLIFSLIPFRVLYMLSDGLSWLFFRVVKFRSKVVFTNLRNSFPEKSQQEINEIAKKFYKNMADILLESIKGFSVDEKTMAKRYRFTNPDMIQSDTRAGGSAITMAAHYTNWEWGAIIFGYFLPQRSVIGFYKPLSNKYIEKYTHNKRSKSGTILIDIGRTAWAFEEYRHQPTTYILVSDQSTYSPKGQWVKFLNQDTICPHGGDKYAHILNYPVYYVNMQRVKRGFYEVSFEKLVDNAAQQAEGYVTTRFMERLEEIIRQKPEDWLWTHKRWKVKRHTEGGIPTNP